MRLFFILKIGQNLYYMLCLSIINSYIRRNFMNAKNIEKNIENFFCKYILIIGIVLCIVFIMVIFINKPNYSSSCYYEIVNNFFASNFYYIENNIIKINTNNLFIAIFVILFIDVLVISELRYSFFKLIRRRNGRKK